MRADLVWNDARRFAEENLGDPDDPWERIIAIPDWDSKEVFRRRRLPRFPAAHGRVRRIGLAVVRDYAGDAREIWREQGPQEVLRRLEAMRLGPQISRMVVGALHDAQQIAGIGQLQADLHLRRVLGRLVAGESLSVTGAHRIADNAPLVFLGKRARGPKPNRGRCYLRDLCTFAA